MSNSLAFTVACSVVVFILLLATTESPIDREDKTRSMVENESDGRDTIDLLKRASDGSDDGSIVYVGPASP